MAETDVTDPRGYVRKVTFNDDGYSTADTRAFGTPEQQAITYNRQPGSGLILSMTDSLTPPRQTAYTYDSMGNTTSITRLAGTANAVTTYFGYDLRFNQLAIITDPLGHTTSFTYDDKGNLVATSDALGNTTSTTYNAAGQPLITTDPMGNPTQFSYDLGDLVAIIDPLGRDLIPSFRTQVSMISGFLSGRLFLLHLQGESPQVGAGSDRPEQRSDRRTHSVSCPPVLSGDDFHCIRDARPRSAAWPCAKLANQCTSRHSARSVPLNDST